MCDPDELLYTGFRCLMCESCMNHLVEAMMNPLGDKCFDVDDNEPIVLIWMTMNQCVSPFDCLAG